MACSLFYSLPSPTSGRRSSPRRYYKGRQPLLQSQPLQLAPVLRVGPSFVLRLRKPHHQCCKTTLGCGKATLGAGILKGGLRCVLHCCDGVPVIRSRSPLALRGVVCDGATMTLVIQGVGHWRAICCCKDGVSMVQPGGHHVIRYYEQHTVLLASKGRRYFDVALRAMQRC